MTAAERQQHLNRDGKQITLCGQRFEWLPSIANVYDYRDGFNRNAPGCRGCRLVAEKIRAAQA